MKRLAFFFLFIFPLAAWAGGNETVNPVPNLSVSGSATVLRTFDRSELPAIQSRLQPVGWVVGGGVHATSGTCTSATFATEAFTSSGNRVTANGVGGSVAIDYSAVNLGCNCANPGSDTAWVAISAAGQSFAADNTRVVDVVPTLPASNFQRVASTNYYVNCSATTQPAAPADTTMLMKATIVNGAITQVDRLFVNASDGIIDPQLPPYSMRCDGLTTNNAATLQLALDAVPLNGAVVQLPRGSCYISGGGPSTFAVSVKKDHTHIRGHGREVTQVLVDSPGFRLAETQDGDYQAMTDFTIEDVGTGAGDHSMVSDGGSTYKVDHFRFERMGLINQNTTHGRTGLFLIGAQSTSGGRWNVVDDVIARGTTIQLGSNKDCSVTHVKSYEPFDVAISVGGSATGDSAGFNPSDTMAGTAQRCEIAHNIIRRTGTTTFTGGSINTNTSYYMNIHDNIVDGAYGPGIHVNPDATTSGTSFGTLYSTIANNTVTHSGLGHVNPQDGINVAGVRELTLGNNTSTRNTGAGLSVRQYPTGPFTSTAVSVTGGVYDNNGQSPGPGYGVASYAVGGLTITGVSCSDTQAVPTQEQGIILIGAVAPTTEKVALNGNQCQHNTANDIATSSGWNILTLGEGNIATNVTGWDLNQGGSVTISEGASSAAVTFANTMINGTYSVLLGVEDTSTTGTAAAGAHIAYVGPNKSGSGFDIFLNADPANGAGTQSVKVHWKVRK